ncbi:MAG: glycosyltransferase [bacterium]|nr:glycosyltransferase [bacterium]
MKIAVFYIVGDGDEILKSKKMVANYGLNNNVIFYEHKTGRGLDEIFCKANILVGSLVLFRIGLKEATPIKIVEDYAKGLPIILSYKDPRFEGVDLIMNISPSEVPVDIKQTIEFYTRGKDRKKNCKLAEDNLFWQSKLNIVLERLPKKI